MKRPFLAKTEGSPIRRTGFQSFKRNIAIALGNASHSKDIIQQLSMQDNQQHQDIVLEHQHWGLQQQLAKNI